MDFELTEEQKAVREAARDFAQNICLPGVIDRDREMRFPEEQVKQLGELGFMGMMVDPKYGGGGMDTVSYVLAMEEISKVDASTSVCMSVNNSLVCWGLETFGTEEQKQKYLVPLAKGEKIGAFCLSEPEAGSDVQNIKTKAIKKGDHYIVTGSKTFITNAYYGDYVVTVVKTDPEKKSNGVSLLVIDLNICRSKGYYHQQKCTVHYLDNQINLYSNNNLHL